jgi:hypothetical protein
MTGDMQGAMDYGQALQRQQLEDRRYVDDTNYTRRVDARNFRQSADQFGVTSDLQRDQLGQDATQHTATMAQNASQFGVTSGLSAAQLAEQRRQFDIEQAAKKAEADAKASGDAVFDGPQLATIYNKSMSELDEARARQAQLDTIANASISFMDVVKGDDWLQGAGPLNDMMQAGSTRTSEAKKLTDTIAPLIRMPGSGGNSDTDVAMFKNSVVNVNNTPQSNKLATEQAVALQQRGQQYVNYLTRTIDPRDPQSKQKADAMWNIYKQENSIFDPQSGKVKTVPTFDDWLDIKMGKAPPVNSFLGRRVQAALPQAPPQDDVSDLLEKYRQ